MSPLNSMQRTRQLRRLSQLPPDQRTWAIDDYLEQFPPEEPQPPQVTLNSGGRLFLNDAALEILDHPRHVVLGVEPRRALLHVRRAIAPFDWAVSARFRPRRCIFYRRRMAYVRGLAFLQEARRYIRIILPPPRVTWVFPAVPAEGYPGIIFGPVPTEDDDPGGYFIRRWDRLRFLDEVWVPSRRAVAEAGASDGDGEAFGDAAADGAGAGDAGEMEDSPEFTR